MRFIQTPLAGVILIEQERHSDERGFFARTWCAEEFARHGLDTSIAQCSVSFNPHRGTLRGLHYQAPPSAEVKVVRCTRGAIFDVVADLRPDSPTFGQWVGYELSAENGRAVYVPRGFGHGFITLMDATEVSYQISVPFAPDAARGIRWDDPFLDVAWPLPVRVISARDAHYPNAQLGQFAELQGLFS